jgi:hypothetical protein
MGGSGSGGSSLAVISGTAEVSVDSALDELTALGAVGDPWPVPHDPMIKAASETSARRMNDLANVNMHRALAKGEP